MVQGVSWPLPYVNIIMNISNKYVAFVFMHFKIFLFYYLIYWWYFGAAELIYSRFSTKVLWTHFPDRQSSRFCATCTPPIFSCPVFVYSLVTCIYVFLLTFQFFGRSITKIVILIEKFFSKEFLSKPRFTCVI